jgi:hypothetical protein
MAMTEKNNEPEQIFPPSEGNEKPSENSSKPDAQRSWLGRRWYWIKSHKKIAIPATVVLVLGLLVAIPFTRYALAGLFMKQTYAVRVLDADTNKAVSSAVVTLDGVEAKTDSQGVAALHVPVGEATLSVAKKYYQTVHEEVLVPIKRPDAQEVKLKATGRTVPVTVVNKVSGLAVGNAVVKAGEAEAKTDKKGQAIIVVPADKKEVQAVISGSGYNNADVTLHVTAETVPENTFQLTPAGKIYFLSNQSGKIDLIKSDLDGSNRQVVLPGTGKEDRSNTVLLASRDWKYIALLSKRDGGEFAKLFLIEAGTDKLSVIDEGEATFSVHGWSGDRLVYSINREKLQSWESKRYALKSFYAPAKKITTLDETAAEGDASISVSEYFGSVYVLDQEIAFTKPWNWVGSAGDLYATKHATLNTVKADGTQKKTLKSYPTQSIQTRSAEFGEIYLQYTETGKQKYDEYKGGKLAPVTLTDEQYYNDPYPTYSVSPSGKKTLWGDYRDGKNVFFVGDGAGQNGKQIGQSQDYAVYGWYSDDYVLLTRKGSEMHIMPAAGLTGGVEKSLKVSDYYKPNYVQGGFGYGYGG